MKRRLLLKSIAASLPLFSAKPSAASPSTSTVENEFFDSLEDIEETEGDDALITCANALCQDVSQSTTPTEEIIEATDELDDQLRRVRFAVRILNEQRITSAIDESMVRSIEGDYDRATRFIPLVGALNNLQSAACAIDEPPEPSQVERFMYACLAFGAEVVLWHSTAPYRMAWSATRFASNRSILRYANHGCNGCIAAMMSELHWALRALPYNVTSEDRIEFISEKLDDLQAEAREIDYDHEIDLDLSEEDIRRAVNSTDLEGAPVAPMPRRSQGPIERYLPPLPDPTDWLPDWLS